MKQKNKEIILTEKQSVDLFLILSNARLKLTGKYKTSAQKYWEEFEKLLIPKLIEDKQ